MTDYLIVALAGVVGTAAMTAYLYLISYITHKQTKVIKVLGTMVTNNTNADGSLSEKRSPIIIGTLIHYLIGIAFAITYLALWRAGIASPDWASAIILGAINGLVGSAGWFVFLSVHKNPPRIPLIFYLFHIFLAHIVFSITTTFTFNLIKSAFSY